VDRRHALVAHGTDRQPRLDRDRGLILRIAALAALALSLVPAARSHGEDVSVVSYNVHGLPSWIARDDPESRMPAIGRLLARYDVALVQEVWGFHPLLGSAVGAPIQREGNAARTPLLGRLSFFCGGCGAGLSFFAELPRERMTAFAAEPYDLCADWLFGANDCWATKGFVFARLRFASGAEVDFYDTHLEAGDGEDDFVVRGEQLEKLRAFVAERSAGRAVILGGDLNLSWDEPRARTLVERFAGALDLRDTGARPRDRSRWPKRIDWILYRDGADLSLSVLEAGEERSFVRDDAPMSDHPAVFARFRVEKKFPSAARAGRDPAVDGDHGAGHVGAGS
jgi:hypothetical protein